MYLRSFITLLICLVSAHAYALMPVAPRPCPQSSVEKNLGELIENVNIIQQRDDQGNLLPLDPRASFKKSAVSMGLTPDEAARIRSSTFHIYCEGGGDVFANDGTANLVGFKDIIVLPVHLVVDEKGRSRGPCSIQLQDYPYTITQLDLSPKMVKLFSPNSAKSNRHFDMALIRLPHAIKSSHPIPLDIEDHAVKPRTPLLVVSASMIDYHDKIARTDMIIQKCHGMNDFAAAADHMSTLKSDCTAKNEASGSAVYVRINGELKFKSMLTNGGDDKYDAREYDPKSPSWTGSIDIDPVVVAEIKKLSGEAQVASANSNSVAD